MRSFIALGDVGVYGLLGSGLEHSDFGGVHPVIYEGAALGGTSLERALLPLDHPEARIRVCRYLTPLDAQQGAEPYPFGTFASFPVGADPLAKASVTWKLLGTSLEDGPDRWRLSEEQPAPVHPFGVHSRKLLESLRPGGLFEHSEKQRSLRIAYYDLRTLWLRHAICVALKADSSEIAKDFQVLRNRIRTENGDSSFPGEKKNSDGDNRKLDSKFEDWTKAVFEAYRKMDTDIDPLAKIPDVTVLYDLYEGSRTRKPLSRTGLEESYSMGLRSVKIPSSYSGIEAAFSGIEPAQGAKPNDKYLKDDILQVLKSLAALTYANLLNEAHELAKGFPNSRTEFEAKTTIGDACKRVVKLYCQEMVSKDIDSPEYKEVKKEWDVWLEKDWESDLVGDASHSPETLSGKERHPLFDACIRMTLRRLALSKTLSQKARIPVAEPLIVVCLKTLKIPHLSRDVIEESDYLNSLYKDEWLRRRTVVILDAEYLRTLKKGPAGISSELSWEETALDTIEAFQRREHLRPYLDFGFLVVRYGISGALLIGRQSGGNMTASLFFDPKKNDRAWTSEENGSVVGYTSILAASIVQAMTVRCDERQNQPVYSDIHEVLNHAIRNALERCQKTCAFGYGTPLPSLDKSKLEDKRWLFRKVVSNNGLIDGIFQPYSYPGTATPPAGSSDQFKHYQQEIAVAAESVSKTFSSSVIPTARTVRWSILGQSCSQDIESVAYQVAVHGIDETLNRIPETRYDRISDVIFYCAKILADHAESINEEKDVDGILVEAKDKACTRAIELLMNDDPTSSGLRKSIIRNEVKSWFEHNYVKFAEALKKYLESVSKKPNEFSNCRAELDKTIRLLVRGLRDRLYDSTVFDYLNEEVQSRYSAPIALFGTKGRQITHVDRREIEGISAIQRLIQHYVRNFTELTRRGKDEVKKNPERQRPLSIAVFGPPGSGKSTIVKRIAEAQGGTVVANENLEYNLSQFTSVEQLDEAFDQIGRQDKDKIPLVFFDEFDSKLEETDFGWLKYFLAPMEDGKFGRHRFGPAIFIFAGGTSYTFAEFCPKTASPADQRWINFSLAKGPDFVSRLSGHLNIIGIDKVDPDDNLYLIRRAILIREFLAREGGIDSDGRAKCDDPALLRAILQAPEYRYGGRSLRMLIKSCLGSDKWLRRSSIPANHELDMMVDSKSFLATLRDS